LRTVVQTLVQKAVRKLLGKDKIKEKCQQCPKPKTKRATAAMAPKGSGLKPKSCFGTPGDGGSVSVGRRGGTGGRAGSDSGSSWSGTDMWRGVGGHVGPFVELLAMSETVEWSECWR
jgi:hypothetical protein